jgi:hypothetical protein
LEKSGKFMRTGGRLMCFENFTRTTHKVTQQADITSRKACQINIKSLKPQFSKFKLAELN